MIEDSRISEHQKCSVFSSYFFDCKSSSNGGAIHSSALLLSVFSSSFVQCHSDNFGGSIYCENPLKLSCDSFTNSNANKGLAFYSHSLNSQQISCAYCTGSVSTFETHGNYAYIKYGNTSYSLALIQASCFVLSPTSYFNVMFMTCTHSSDISSPAFACYYSHGLLSLLNAYNISSQASNHGLLVVGRGGNITIMNSSFHHSGHIAIFSLYEPWNTEIVTIQNCHFVSPFRTFINCVKTIAITFEEQFYFVPYKVEGKCEQILCSLCETNNAKMKIVFLFIFFLCSQS